MDLNRSYHQPNRFNLVFSLLCECPAVEQSDCILAEKRKKPLRDRYDWARALPDDALETIYSHHHKCLSKQANKLIAESKGKYALLKSGNDRFRELVNSTDGIIWEADAQTFTFTFVSEQAVRLLGFSTAEWYQPGFWVERLHPEDRAWAPEYCASCTGRLEPHDFEYRFIAKDGRTVWLRDIVSVVTNDGQPRWLRGVMVDITEQKKLEAELIRTKNLLTKTQSLANLGGWHFDRATGELTWTEEVYRIHRVPPEFNANGPTRYINFYVPEDRPKVANALKRALEAAEPFDLELRLMLPDDEIAWVRVIGDPEIADGAMIGVTGNIMDITERKKAEEKMLQVALVDPLTGLPNRRYLFDRLDKARASCSRLNLKGALLYIDLDNFKQVNDMGGHEAGDRLLKRVAKCLKGCIRESDTIARLGGDEFIVMLEFVDRPNDQVTDSAGHVGQKILSRFRADITKFADCTQVTPSIGVALFDGTSDMLEVLRQADQAMYQAKANGRSTVCFYGGEEHSKPTGR